MKTRRSAPTTAKPLVPVKPVSQRMFEAASGPESPGRTRSPTISMSRPSPATSSVSLSARSELIQGASTAARFGFVLSSSASYTQPLLQYLEGVTVTVGALARDRRQHEALEHGVAPPLLARLDVREVDLDRRHAR